MFCYVNFRTNSARNRLLYDHRYVKNHTLFVEGYGWLTILLFCKNVHKFSGLQAKTELVGLLQPQHIFFWSNQLFSTFYAMNNEFHDLSIDNDIEVQQSILFRSNRFKTCTAIITISFIFKTQTLLKL